MYRLIRHRLLADLILVSALLLSTPIILANETLQAGDPILEIFPTATHVGAKSEQPPVWPVYQITELIGFAFNTNDLVNILGFTGTPVEMLVGLNPQGEFTDVKILSHNEPIFLHGVGEEYMLEFIRQYAGLSVKNTIKVRTGTETSTAGANVYIDGVTKATASVVIINDTILLSALKIASKKLAGFPSGDKAEVHTEVFNPMNWQQLLAAGYIQNIKLKHAQVEAGFADTEVAGLSDIPNARASDLYIDLYLAYLNAPTIGHNLLGDADYQRLFEDLQPGEHAIMLMSNGPASFLGAHFVDGSVADTLALQQGGLPIELRDVDFYGFYEQNTPAIPAFAHTKLFRMKTDSIFDPGSAWRLDLLVNRSKGRLYGDISARFPIQYKLPAEFYYYPEPLAGFTNKTPLWVTIWSNRIPEIIILSLSLVLLTLIIIFQHKLAHHPVAFTRLRWGFLVYTLLFIGWYSQGQLSIVNVYTLILNALGDFSMAIYLIDPIIFILWTYTFITLIIFGRGFFCGWLCPFGALQEIISWFARRLGIRQIQISRALHRKLWSLKYIAFVAIIGSSFYSISAAGIVSEIEPFKTALTMVFVRAWPYVLYSLLILGIGLFIHKFFCRYLCPLGAGLAIFGLLGRARWLSRRNECGSRCQYCSSRCEIRAIEESGAVNYNECIQCLECIVIYHDEKQCPVLMLDLKGKPMKM